VKPSRRDYIGPGGFIASCSRRGLESSARPPCVRSWFGEAFSGTRDKAAIIALLPGCD